MFSPDQEERKKREGKKVPELERGFDRALLFALKKRRKEERRIN